MDTKQCKSCHQIKSVSEFYVERYLASGRPSYRNQCKECTKKRAVEWRKKYPERNKKKGLKYYRKIRLRALLHYSLGDLKCACCGESHIEFLTLDHIDNGGSKHRKELKKLHTDIFHWVHGNNYPRGFQVLCMNCNFAKGLMGGCPHEKIKNGTYEPLDVSKYLERTVRHNERTRLITYRGETHSLSEWSKILKIDYRVLSCRINNHKWTVERAFEQAIDQNRNEILLTHRGETHTLADWASSVGIRRDTLWKRIYQGGWSVERALSTPAKHRH